MQSSFDWHLLYLAAVPIGIGILLTWAFVWMTQIYRRNAKCKKWPDRFIMVYALIIGVGMGVLCWWMLDDFVTYFLKYNVNTTKGFVAGGLMTGGLSPILFRVLLWFLVTPLDMKVIKKRYN